MADRIVVTGAGGFIGGHLVSALVQLGHRVTGIDVKPLKDWWQVSEADNRVADLRDPESCSDLLRGRRVDTVYHLAADMGGIEYITRHDWECATSVAMTVNILRAAREYEVSRFVYTSSACVYPKGLQGRRPKPLRETDIDPPDPEGGYGWEKYFSERICRYAADRIPHVRVARLFNVYGPHGAWNGGREKAPAAICRKVNESAFGGDGRIVLHGDGSQLRSYLYVDDCVSGLIAEASSAYADPVNLASLEVVSVADLARLVASIADVSLALEFDRDTPTGVQARIPDISRAARELGWRPSVSLREGMRRTYEWVAEQSDSRRRARVRVN